MSMLETQTTGRQPFPAGVPQRRDDGSEVNMSNRDRGIAAGFGLLSILWATGQNRSFFTRLFCGTTGGLLLQWAATGRCEVYEALGIDSAHAGRATPEDFYERGVHVTERITIEKPRAELYEFWRNFENLPKFMSNLKAVEVIDQRNSHWVTTAPGDYTMEWDAAILDDVPNELIAWRSLEGADVDTAGSVRFLEAGDGRTEVVVTMEYIPPLGRLGHALSKLWGKSADQQIRGDLGRFKQIMEESAQPAGQE